MIPKLRFPEFSSEWKNRKLGNFSDVRDGTHESPKYTDIGYPLITSKNLLKNGNIDLKNVNYITKSDYESINKRSGVSVGDILFGMIGTIGNPVRLSTSDFAIKNVALIKERTALLNSYLIHYLNCPSINKQFHTDNSGGTQKFIALGVIRNLTISAPEVSEQQKIADFLTAVDEQIELISKKVYLLKQYKKSVMQKIFSQQIRFEDEDGNPYPDWKNKKLGDIATIKTGNLNVQDALENGKYTFFDRSEEIKKYDEYSFDNEALIYAGEGSEFSPRYFNGKYGLHQRAYAIFNAKNANVRFLYFFMLTQNRHFLRMAVGSTVKSLRMDCFEKCVVALPNIDEQQKIADFLTTLDDKINLAEKESNQAKQFKKSLLQRMFV